MGPVWRWQRWTCSTYTADSQPTSYVPHSFQYEKPPDIWLIGSIAQLDVGGGATADAVKKAFELLLTAKNVRSIFVNICK